MDSFLFLCVCVRAHACARDSDDFLNCSPLISFETESPSRPETHQLLDYLVVSLRSPPICLHSELWDCRNTQDFHME